MSCLFPSLSADAAGGLEKLLYSRDTVLPRDRLNGMYKYRKGEEGDQEVKQCDPSHGHKVRA